MIDIIKKLIAIRSDGDEKECMDFLYAYISKTYGKKMDIQKEYIGSGRYNLIVQNSPNPKLLLAGHLDTVPITSIEQLNPILKDGKLYGRGAIDMKGGVGIIIDLIPRLLIKNVPFMLLFYCDEEYNFLGMKSFVQNYKVKIAPKLTIIPEATNLKIVSGFRGIGEYRIAITGKSAHAARAYQGISAIDILIGCKAYLLEKLYCDDIDGFSTSINIGGISGGTLVEEKLCRKGNVVADTCEILLDIRLGGKLSQSDFESMIQTYCNEKGVILKILECNFRLPSLSQKLGSSYAKIAEIDLGMSFGYSDIQIISEYIGGDCILCGPAPGDKSHKPDEYVQVESLYKAKNMIQSIIEDKICGDM